MRHTVIALFDEARDARKAAESLRSSGFGTAAVHVAQDSESVDTEVISPAVEIESGPLTGLMHRLSMLFGVEEPHLAHYEEAVRRRGSVVQVDAADETQAIAARDTLLAMGAVNIDDRVEEWQRAGWRGTAEASAEAAGSTRRVGGPGVVVHRQEISIGGVRIYGRRAVAAFDDLVDDFRADYHAQHAVPGTTYDDFDPAYRYGHAMASETSYDGCRWDEIEPEARAGWERRHPQRTWEQFKGAVRHAWERAKLQ